MWPGPQLTLDVMSQLASGMTIPMKPTFSDIELALYYISTQPEFTNYAYLCRRTGRIYYASEFNDSDDDLPDDIDDDDKYVCLPHKNELDLGKRLVHQFVRDNAPKLIEPVYEIFSHKGAYARFKSLLESEKLIEQWHRFEETSTSAALKDWCRENGIEFTENDRESESTK